MYIVVGATGHVGSAVARELLQTGAPLTIVTRDPERGANLQEGGAQVAVADVRDVTRMREVFSSGARIFIMNPPANPSTDTDAEEREDVRCLLAALSESRPDRVVAQSTYGARPGERCGDLTVLFELEEGLRTLQAPVVIVRAAYHMSNWDGMLATVREHGVLPTMMPADLCIPMVSPDDIGAVAAAELLNSGKADLLHVEGPNRYSPLDVAAAFANALGREVDVLATPRGQWLESFRSVGFSEPAALSYARMTAIVADGDYELPAAPVRGKTTLSEYIDRLVRDEGASAKAPTSEN